MSIPNAQAFPSRIISAFMGGLVWLEDYAKRGGTVSQGDKQCLLQVRARLAVLVHDLHNNEQEVTRQQHNQRLIRP